MIRRGNRCPKLRAKGAETRYLVKFAAELSEHLYEIIPSDLHRTVRDMFVHLMAFYELLGQEPFDPRQASKSCRRCFLLYSVLSNKSPEKIWSVKPKFHMWQGMAEFQSFSSGDPARFWTYADESFVGLLGVMAFSRGGKREVMTVPRELISKYRAAWFLKCDSWRQSIFSMLWYCHVWKWCSDIGWLRKKQCIV